MKVRRGPLLYVLLHGAGRESLPGIRVHTQAVWIQRHDCDGDDQHEGELPEAGSNAVRTFIAKDCVQNLGADEQSVEADSQRVSGMKVDPEKRERRQPPEHAGPLRGTFEQKKKDAREQQREHLRTHAPGRSGSSGSPRRDEGSEVGPRLAAQENDKERRRNNCSEHHDESRIAQPAIKTKHQDLRKPFMIDPRMTSAGERVRVGAEDVMRLKDQLPCAEMPPDIGISDGACGHGEQAKGEDEDEGCAGLQEFLHLSRESYKERMEKA